MDKKIFQKITNRTRRFLSEVVDRNRQYFPNVDQMWYKITTDKNRGNSIEIVAIAGWKP
ncbi:MAG: hypothetical protein ACTSVU_05850 [Promethearchaeota archaeon]